MAVFTDSFTGTDGDDLEGRTGWTRVDGVAGAAEINASNQLKFSTTTDSAYTAPDAGTADHYAQAEYLFDPAVVSNTSFFPVCVRLTDKDNFIGLRILSSGGAKRQLFKRVSGTLTMLYEDAINATPRIFKLECSGNDIYGYRDGGAMNGGLPLATTTDHNTVQTPGLVVRITTRDPCIDDWESLQADAGGQPTMRRWGGSIMPTGAQRIGRGW